MMLTPVFKSADPDFNYRAAADAARLVMSMDEEEARSFTTMVVAETLWDDIAKNQRTLQTHLNTVVARRVGRVAKAADRVVSKGRDEFGTALVEISKATRNPYDWGYVFNESDFNRDPGSGQFRAKVRYTTDRPIPKRIARNTKNMPSDKKVKRYDLNARQKAHYQQGYQQIADFLDTMQQSGLTGDTKTYVTIQEDPSLGGRTYKKEVSGTEVPEIDPGYERFIGIEARPTSLNVGGASFGLVSALGGGAHRAGQVGATMNAVDRNLPSFADDWTSAGVGNPELSNARLYGRLAAGSSFLSQVAPAGSHLQMASVFGEFIGRQGPQAERVLGPRARTTMYRYRGTEKAPDTDLTGPYERLRTGGYSFDNLNPENQKKVRALQRSAITRYKNSHGGKITPEEAEQVRQVVLRRQFNVSARDAAEAAEAGRTRSFQAAQTYMSSKVPNDKLYDLQLKSGHTPPSEGVIIDKNGKIVTQAIGYGDDHYLPFNLKNLKGLRGGEYIRTRSVGGPTTEDIYTGLVSGASRLTVVSRSGTFTVTFDDTFRGTRRYNDKAGRMVGRYGKILDAIKSEQVQRQALDPEVRGQIAADVDLEMGSFSTPKEIRREISRREAEYKEHPTLTKTDEARIEERVSQIGGDERTRNAARAQLRNDLLESKAYNFRLNGDGYAAAIKALEEQFPYYLKSDFRPTREGRYEAAIDRSYVKPRFNRPEGALEGYFDTSINGEGGYTSADGSKTGKNTADRVDYQNSRGRLARVAAAAEQAPEAVKAREEAAKPTVTPPTPAEAMADRIESAKVTQDLTDAAVELQKHVKVRTEGQPRGVMSEVLAMDPEQFRTWYASPANQEKFHQLTETTVRGYADALGANDLLRRYNAARGLAGGQKFSRASHMMSVPDQPYSFEGAEYLRAGNIDKKQRELDRVSHRSHVPGFGPLSELVHDSDFQEALRAAQKLRVVSDQLRQFSTDPEQRNSYLRELIRDDETVRAMTDDEKKLLTNPEKVDQMVEDVNRAWALRKLIGAPAPAAAPPAAEPEGVTLRGAPPTPAQQAATPERKVTSPGDNRAAMMDFRAALSTYAQAIAGSDPPLAEAIDDIANRFDVAAFSGKASDMQDAYAQLDSLYEDRPEHREAIGQAVMNQMRKRY